MRKTLLLALIAGIIPLSCPRYIQDGTYKGFKHPLPTNLEHCLGDTTISLNKNISSEELYSCAQFLYLQAHDFDCPMHNKLTVEELCADALLNINAIPKDKMKDEYLVLKNKIEILKNNSSLFYRLYNSIKTIIK